MTALVSLDLIKFKLAQRVDSLVPQLFPNARQDGPRYWRLGSLAGEPGQSLVINRTGRHQGQYRDFTSGETGSMLDLVALGLCGGNLTDAIRRSRELVGLGSMSPAEMRAQERKADLARAAADRAAEERADKVRGSCARIFKYESQPLPGTPADAYLAGRGIRLGEIGGSPRALRFHEGLMHPQTAQKHPCLVALVMGIDGEAKGIHRTFLMRRADGSWGKLTGTDGSGKALDAKLSLGPIKGGHIPLWRGETGKPMAAMPHGEWIALTEGIEDALSIAIEVPSQRCWAGISLSNMGGIDLPGACGGVWWHRHRDGPEATKAADQAVARMMARGMPVEQVYAPGTFKDFNEQRQDTDARRFAQADAPALEMTA